MSKAVSPPEHLTAEHDVAGFDCGVPELDDWLKRRALQNEASRAARTFVVVADGRVVGYYALATGAVAHRAATGRVRRNMPEPIPVMVLARLAVDREYQGSGLGTGLLRDALFRTLRRGHRRYPRSSSACCLRRRQALLPPSWLCRVARRSNDDDDRAGRCREGYRRLEQSARRSTPPVGAVVQGCSQCGGCFRKRERTGAEGPPVV